METLNEAIKKNLEKWRSHARGLMKSQVKGDDLLAEVLLKICENQKETAEKLASEGKLTWYVNRSIYLMSIDESSRYALKYERYASAWKDDDDSFMSIEEDRTWLGSRIDNEYLDSWIALMPEKEAIMMRLYMMDGFSYSDLSQATGIPVKILYKITEKAITKLRKHATLRSSSSR